MTTPANPNPQYTGPTKVYTAITEDVDLTFGGSRGPACLIYITGPGDLRVVNRDGSEEVIPEVTGILHLFGQYIGIKLADTTATKLVVVW